MKYLSILFIFLIVACESSSDVTTVRQEISLNNNWETIHLDSIKQSEADFVKNLKTDSTWKQVSVPHNWDQYYGYRRSSHGNLHGTAWYQKNLKLDNSNKEKQHFLFFEGVGSYATVWVNGKKVGEHKGGRTTFTLNISDAIVFDAENKITVKAYHPSFV
ncbi:sugar-binding domain-containing protein, partial [Polaribacter sp.]|uniref:sugar-binding domain-containing protein n=1 Tax=Polaribacter sp. TaxID=1920175 RepID=UPI003F6B29DC